MTSILKATIDEKWEDCWPVSKLRPLAMLDLLSYIFFVKKLDEKDLINKILPATGNNVLIYPGQQEQFSWSGFRNMDAQQIHDLFTKENGLIDSLVYYSNSGDLYSDFFKAPLLLTPTPRLLSNVIQIINIIETSEKNTRAAIIEYLINKTEITTQDGQVYLPEHIARLMVATSDPLSKDIIIDPSVGNGSLLVHAAKFIANNSNSVNPEFNIGKTAEMLKGVDSDLVQLRIAGLNLILHGIKNPELEAFPGISNNDLKTSRPPTLFISNLYFVEPDKRLPGEVNAEQKDHPRKDVIFLDFILKNLKPGGRVVVLVPEFFLFSNDVVISNLRREIVDNNKLEGVISLPAKSNALLSGAGILIFSKYESILSGNVWFFRMKAGKEQVGKNEQNFSEATEADDILNNWNSRKVAPVNDPNQSFYVSVYDIKTNNYILSFSDYKMVAKKRELKKNAENNIAIQENRIVTASEENQDHSFEESFLSEKKKTKRKTLTAIIVLVVLAITASGIYFYNFKNSMSGFANLNEVVDSISNRNVVTKASPVKELSDSSIRGGSLDSSPAGSKGYSVISKAYFYSQPDVHMRRSLYLLHRNDFVLHPTDEQNGFVYIVYVNKNGRTTKGWVSKKDLQPVQ